MHKFVLPMAGLALASSISQASAETLSPVIVTATRTAQTADQSLASVTVVTRQDIERLQANNLQEVLTGLPGLNLANNGGPGKNTSVFLRGTESDHVLVLIDGVEIGSATTGSAAFQYLPVEQIERIEIVRGPRSTLYGSEAIGGVIQIFTRKGGAGVTPVLSLGSGSHQTFQASAGLNGGTETTWFNLNVSRYTTNGFNSCSTPTGTGGCWTVEPDDDGYSNTAGSFRLGHRFGDRASIELYALRSAGDNEYDGSFSNENTYNQQAMGATASLELTPSWSMQIRAGRGLDESKSARDGNFSGRYNTERDTFLLQNDLTVGDTGLLTLGLDYQDDKVDSSTAYARTSRSNLGLFGQYQAALGEHDFLAALRLDDNEQFGNHVTGNLGWGYALLDGLRLTAGYGTAFKAPTFNELYYPGYGNPDIDPESSQSLEFGLAGAAFWGDWSVNVYQTEIDDLIAYDAAIFAPNNVDSARIRGLELSANTRLAGWDASADLTLMKPENRGNGGNRGNLLPRRSETGLRILADRDFGDFTLGATINAQGRRYDDLGNTRKLDGYVTVDLRLDYALNRNWLLQGKVGNLFDEDYQTASYYNQDGRNVFLTLRYRPED